MKLPRHIAVIMDGNGRWAKLRGQPRVAGHKVGVESVRALIKECVEKKIEVLTLFAFSTENWQRPPEEINYLMEQLFTKLLASEVAKLHTHQVKLQIVGNITNLTTSLRQEIFKAEELTANNEGLHLVIAISYSGRWDITEAMRKLGKDIEAGKLLSQDITIQKVQDCVCLHDLPEPDLLIRTSGEKRISNFMLWQLAYTELYFTDILWPDFREAEFNDALIDYDKRIRRFGRC